MRKIFLGSGIDKIHFIGVGGISMSGLAEILFRDGYFISGSDETESETTERLRALGVEIKIGASAENIPAETDLVVYTAAVRKDNVEYAGAVSRGLALADRAKLLGIIMESYEKKICVAGTHGKTSTTALVAEIFAAAGLDPTVSIGGCMKDGSNIRIGAQKYFILEACEYSDSFLQWSPDVGIILNVDTDHLDYFGDMERLTQSFARFAKNISRDGTLAIWGETIGFDKITSGLECKTVTYGIDGDYDFTARNIAFDREGRPSFDIYKRTDFLSRAALKITGEHQILNALAAAAAASAYSIPNDSIGGGLNGAGGVRRRFEYKGVWNGATVVDDYAHHPTEIKANLKAARMKADGGGGRLVCAFQPHNYSRTKSLLDDFAESFGDADLIILLPIYTSRESDAKDISSLDLLDKLRMKNANAAYAGDFREAVGLLARSLKEGDLLITMGAGDVHRVGELLLRTGLSTISTD